MYSFAANLCSFVIISMDIIIITLIPGKTKSIDHLCHPVPRSQIRHPTVIRINCHIAFFKRLYLFTNPIASAVHILKIPPDTMIAQYFPGVNVIFTTAAITAKTIQANENHSKNFTAAALASLSSG